MGFFKDFKEDLSETAGDLGDIAKNSDNEDFMVNTLDVNVNDVQLRNLIRHMLLKKVWNILKVQTIIMIKKTLYRTRLRS